MYDFERMDKRLLIFANLFLVANRLQANLDSKMEDMTAKQWLLMMLLGMFDEPPTLGQLAQMADCSHQNTRQLVRKLEQRGYVTITPDPADGRAMRIAATAKVAEWDSKNSRQSTDFISRMFGKLSPEEIIQLDSSLQKVYRTLAEF